MARWTEQPPQPPPGLVGDRPRIVRPYAITGGRTHSSYSDLSLEALVVTTETASGATSKLTWERKAIAELCVVPVAVAEISAHLSVPLGVARILVGDMADEGLVRVHRPAVSTGRADVALLERVLNGIRAL